MKEGTLNLFVEAFIFSKSTKVSFKKAWQQAENFQEIEHFENPPFYLLLQILAENSSRKELREALQLLEPAQQLQLIGELFTYYREGSWFLLRELEEWKELIENLRSGYWSLAEFKKGKSFTELENHARKESAEVLNLLKDIVPAMVKAAGVDISEYFGDYHFTQAEMVKWTQLFGLKGNFPFLQIEGTDFKEKLTYIKAVFENPLLLVKTEEFRIKLYLYFIKTWVEHLRTLNRHPEYFKEGLDKLIFAIPTKERDLDHEATLETLLIGLKVLCDAIQYPIKKIPIYVFDQSMSGLSQHNKKVIDQLNTKFSSHISHFDLDYILKKAADYKIRPLIETADNNLGFGGMRNCVFLLSPLIKDMSLPLFDSSHRILMSDDDNEFPVSNFFCHAYFAAKKKGEFIGMRTYFTGRNTQLIEVPLKGNPSTIHAKWTDQPFFASMSEYNGNSKLCLDLPFASEEGQLDTAFEHYPLLKASLHLSGPRYPTEEKTLSYTSYAFGVLLVQWLLDPLKKHGLCALPWNDDSLPLFKSLREAVVYMAKAETEEEMKRRFWNNMKLDNKLSEVISLMPETDDVNFLREYKKNVTQKNVESLKTKMEIKHHIRFEDYPLTHHLYLICKRVGTGEFCRLVRGLI